MLLNGKRLDELQEADLLNLIGEDESTTLDFKKNAYFPFNPSTPLTPDAEKKIKEELAADICSFANARGGWIICGMDEDGQGKAVDLVGLGPINPDDYILRLKQSADSQIEPRIFGLDFKAVDLSDAAKSKVIVIYIPRSLNKPHWVKATKKFHIRGSRGKEEMDLNQLREAFNLSESLIERIRTFRSKRIDALDTIDHEAIPFLLDDGPYLILHSIPLSFSETHLAVDLSLLHRKHHPSSELTGFADNGGYNADGFARPYGREIAPRKARGYIQTFRHGSVEIVEKCNRHLNDDVIQLSTIEQLCLEQLEDALRIQSYLAVELPLVIAISFFQVKDYKFELDARDQHLLMSRYVRPQPVRLSKILLPDVAAINYGENLKSLLRPIFDVIWNIAGHGWSMSYDANGVWTRTDY